MDKRPETQIRHPHNDTGRLAKLLLAAALTAAVAFPTIAIAIGGPTTIRYVVTATAVIVSVSSALGFVAGAFAGETTRRRNTR